MESLLPSAESQVSGTSNNERYRFVIDTSVLISAIFFGGISESVLRHVIAHHIVILSDDIIEEFMTFANTAKPEISRKTLRLMRAKLEEYLYEYRIKRIKDIRDINDVHVVQLALAHKASIISSDKDLLDYKAESRVTVISVGNYSELFSLN